MINRLLALTATALLAVGLGACGDDDDSEAASVTTTTETTTSTTETPPETTTTTEGAPRIVDAAETARVWIAEIGGGDLDGAMALTSERAMAAIGGEAGFRESEIPLAEGWGAWDFAEDLEVTAVEIDSGLAVVVLHGTVSQEGPPEESWAAMPVVATDAGDRVEPFVLLGEPEVDPPANTDIPAEGRLAAYVLAGREVFFIVDDNPMVEPAVQSADGDQQLAELDVSGLEPGLHALTVVQRNDDGVMARTFLYGVAG